MKITFEDGSFLEFMPSAQDDNKLTVILCGFKDINKLTMATSEIDRNNVSEIIEFLSEWNAKNS